MYPPPTPGSYALIDPGVGGGYMGVLIKLCHYFYLKMLGVYSFKTDRWAITDSDRSVIYKTGIYHFRYALIIKTHTTFSDRVTDVHEKTSKKSPHPDYWASTKLH